MLHIFDSLDYKLFTLPYKEREIEKLYYSIGEVAEMFGVSKSLIRFWETEFEILKPRKSSKGNRLFTKKDIDNLKVIYHLVKEKGFTLDGARRKLKEAEPAKLESNVDVLEKLKAIKLFLVDLNKQL
ncbi:MAG: MerR family transcriptional regulator [Chitinophagales bacterium]|nr:MerR family transcriptional regulator [Chitinophagales bacterium]MCZ2394779.1 MerR family transcriptional regulator [Chitinophagales bacterium]